MRASDLGLMPSLTLFAIAGFIFYRFRYYLEWDQKEAAWPKDVPRHVKVWIGIAIGLFFVGAFIAPSPL